MTALAASRWPGPFASQPNNSTRAWEYPWAYHALPVAPGTSVVDLGGGLSGFQFVLSAAGCRVVNVDPFSDYGTPGEYDAIDPADAIDRMNRMWGTSVTLRRSTLGEADLADTSVDTLYSISTIEHLDEEALARTASGIRRVLRAGGSAVITIDLFLDLAPFTTRPTNQWGRNIDVRALVEATGMDLVAGEPAELCGFDEFDPGAVQSRLSELLIGEYPAVAQCLVLRR